MRGEAGERNEGEVGAAGFESGKGRSRGDHGEMKLKNQKGAAALWLKKKRVVSKVRGCGCPGFGSPKIKSWGPGRKIQNRWAVSFFCWPRGLVSNKSKTKGGAAVFGFLGFGFL